MSLTKPVAAVAFALATFCFDGRAGAAGDSKDAAPPPLPFVYIGKVTQDGRTTVYLSRDQFSYAARVGENVDNEYRVDAIEDNRILLTYLPLGIQRVLSFSSSIESLALTVNAPQQVAVEQEFLVTLGIQGAAAQGINATVVLSYDSALLEPVDGDGTPGRMTMRIPANPGGSGKPTLVRFLVLGGAPSVTKIEISAQATDQNGRALDIKGPNSHSLRIVP
jgi:hypothetical protein